MFVYFGPYDFVQISLACGTNILRNVWRDYRLTMSALATVAGKSLTANLLQKMIPDRIFYITVVDADIRGLQSLHTLFDKYLDHMLVKLNKIVWSELKRNWSFWQKMFTIFEKVLTLFWKMFLWRKQLFDANLSI